MKTNWRRLDTAFYFLFGTVFLIATWWLCQSYPTIAWLVGLFGVSSAWAAGWRKGHECGKRDAAEERARLDAGRL